MRLCVHKHRHKKRHKHTNIHMHGHMHLSTRSSLFAAWGDDGQDGSAAPAVQAATRTRVHVGTRSNESDESGDSDDSDVEFRRRTVWVKDEATHGPHGPGEAVSAPLHRGGRGDDDDDDDDEEEDDAHLAREDGFDSLVPAGKVLAGSIWETADSDDNDDDITGSTPATRELEGGLYGS